VLQTLAISPVAWEPAVTGWAASGLAMADLTVAGFWAAGSTAARLIVMGVMAVKAEIVVGVEGT
jgi:hypothetical protein